MEALDFSKTNDFIEYAHELDDTCGAEANSSAFDEEEGVEGESGESRGISIPNVGSTKNEAAKEFGEVEASEEVHSRDENHSVDESEDDDHEDGINEILSSDAAQTLGNHTQVSSLGWLEKSKLPPHNHSSCFPTSSFASPAPFNPSLPHLSSLTKAQATTAPTYPSVFGPFSASAGSGGALPGPASSVFSTSAISTELRQAGVNPAEKVTPTPALTSSCLPPGGSNFFEPKGTSTGKGKANSQLRTSIADHPAAMKGKPLEITLHSDGITSLQSKAREDNKPAHAASTEQLAGGRDSYYRRRAATKSVLDTPQLRFSVFLRGSTSDWSGIHPSTREGEVLEGQKVLRRFEQVVPTNH
ncbi:unnamed protein product [Phytomonas sp. EM1]|nr:unnamed protein product [Phytomonas sp. EM1]|eukprot:CCW62066.1 unnamed protein product [Phytomonas sp. isolate EM1]